MKRFASVLLAAGLVLGGGVAAIQPAQAAPAVQIQTATTVRTAITAQPKSQTAVHGSTVKLSVSARGTSLKYQWYKKGLTSKAWSKISGATSRTLTLSKVSVASSKTQYQVSVTGRAGKVWSKPATVAVRYAYKPVVTSLSPASTVVGQARSIAIYGQNFHDVTRVTVAGKSVAFKKTSMTTKLLLTVPSSSTEKTVTITVSSATGSSSKSFTYFKYLSATDRAGMLADIDWAQRTYGAPQAPVKSAYDTARNYIRSTSAHEGAADKQYLIALYAIDYSWLTREAALADADYRKWKTEYDIAIQFGDNSRAADYKAEMDYAAADRDAYRDSAKTALANIRSLGGKV
ncbi:IPT/TIG domain-containing protein [Crystallibacter crystallopoietes]|uniref:IPT/TIG domain-containing protein n=1 Tax=Crystallibacter crystallopoietes TaxID=37928 RepID=UPI0002A51E7F|nr:IPT/TIG domain-containing protein [Arthrobacter crystallopoietes]